MIKSFGSKATEDLYHGVHSKAALRIAREIWKVALRKLDMIEAASQLRDLAEPPGNRLESLKGPLIGKYSIRINDQYRIVFRFETGDAYEVEITDYH